MAEPLNYATRQARQATPASAIASLVISMVGMVGAAAAVLFVVEGDVIGDAYGPLVGIIYGGPATLAHLLLVLMPVVMMSLPAEGARFRRGQIAALAMAALSTLVVAGLALACVAAPRTHGSSC